MVAWICEQQKRLQPKWTESDKRYQRNQTLSWASVIMYHGEYERGVSVYKRVWFLSNGFLPNMLKNINYAWMTWLFQDNLIINWKNPLTTHLVWQSSSCLSSQAGLCDLKEGLVLCKQYFDSKEEVLMPSTHLNSASWGSVCQIYGFTTAMLWDNVLVMCVIQCCMREYYISVDWCFKVSILK